MTGKQKDFGALTFGLDIGIASVGWAVLGENRIIDLGVRCFDKAETAKEGESLNLARRTARLMRRRLRRRAWRLTKLARLLKREGLIADTNLFKQPPAKGQQIVSAWQLRVAGLDRLLTAEEWARVIYHLCKHRGFHWISRAEEKAAESDGKGEGGAVTQALKKTKSLKEKYRTAAEMVINEFPDAQRNKQGDYSKALSRELLADELKTLFQRQRKLGNPHASEQLEAAILGNGDKKSGLFWAQKPALSGNSLLEMLGRCTFERPPKGSPGPDGKGEYRAPKASFTAERHVWLTRLNNLRIVVDGKLRSLTETERQIALPLPYQQISDSNAKKDSYKGFSFKQLRKALTKAGLTDEFRFSGLSYPSAKQKIDDKAKDPEDEKLIKLPAWQELCATLKEKGLETEWQQISVAALDGKPQLLDQIAWVLSVYKEDKEIETELYKLDLPNKTELAKALSVIKFDKFSNLSIKALYNILPHMEVGGRYDVACQKAGYHHSLPNQHNAQAKFNYLPPFYIGREKDGRLKFNDNMDIPRNPVVLRALNQARKVVNALIQKYRQQPYAVHIELARELSKPLVGYPTKNGGYKDGRREIEQAQKEFRARNEEDWEEFKGLAQSLGLREPPERERHGRDFAKWQLYREQFGKSAYSLNPIDTHRLLERGYVEIDHALPYSRSYDDSKNNRVLVLTPENQEKGNKTPYEYLDGKNNSERWRQFVANVESNKSYRQAKRNRLLRKDFGEEESKSFRDRNLNDTRYICKFFKNYVEQYLQLHSDSEAKRCVVLSGQMTSFLRMRWGLSKVRSESDRHHALDAAVVAACSHGMVKRLSDYSRRKEIEKASAGFVDVTTGEIADPAMFDQLEQHFPNPWQYFRNELEARLKLDDPALLHEELQRLGTYTSEELESVKPLFVSRAPQRRNSGAAHKETIYAKPRPDHKLKVEEKAKNGEKISRQANATELQSMAIEQLGVFDTADKGKKYRLTSARLQDIVGAERNAWMIRALELWVSTRGDNPKQSGTKSFPRKPQRGDPQDGPFTGPEIKSVKVNAGKMSGFEIRGGIAQNDSMLRVDVFTKANKFHLVPVYVHHSVAKDLPNRAIVAFKDESEWTLIDESFAFCFSLYPNDLVCVKLKGSSSLGYFAGCDRSTAGIGLWAHDRSTQVGKDGLIRVGVKMALSVEKFNVDVLGNIYPAPAEKRRDLA